MSRFLLTYAGIPFVSDTAKSFCIKQKTPENEYSQQSPEILQQPEMDLFAEVDRLIPFQYLQDFGGGPVVAGRNLQAIAARQQASKEPNPQVRIGDWYYPNRASRWSVFRGLATSTMAKAMLAATQKIYPGGTLPSIGFTTFQSVSQPFIMQASQDSIEGINPLNYVLESQMYMLPPRPLGETSSSLDGLFLITLVDERYFWQYANASLHFDSDTTWDDLLEQLTTVLGISNFDYTTISTSYGRPEPDSQLWCNQENAALLLDAVAANIGTVVVRNMDGSYELLRNAESAVVATDNRGSVSTLFRMAGGDMFASGSIYLPSGDLTKAKNLVIPYAVDVTFPKYVVGDDPVPHFINPRYKNQRPSCQFEESFGDVYSVRSLVSLTPFSSGIITSGGTPVINLDYSSYGTYGASGTFLQSGVGPLTQSLNSGVSETLNTTAKALYLTEDSDYPINSPNLVILASQLAQDYYDQQILVAFDEVYPGTYAWSPEGIHDIIWTYSERSRLASTRVVKTQWNQVAEQFQHATPPPTASGQSINVNYSGAPIFTIYSGRAILDPVSGGATNGYFPQTDTPRGVGGPSVALNVRDSYSGSLTSGMPTAKLAVPLFSGDLSAAFKTIDYFPTDNRWRGLIGSEVILFEGTSGGFPGSGTTINSSGLLTSGGFDVDIVNRAIDGSVQASGYPVGINITQLGNVNYGTNLLTHGPGSFIYPSDWTSGGIQAAQIVPQVQTVFLGDDVGTVINGARYYSGAINLYNPVIVSGPFSPTTDVWLLERNGAPMSGTSGMALEGQFLGYSPVQIGVTSGSASGTVGITAPVYGFNKLGATASGIAATLYRLSGVVIGVACDGSGNISVTTTNIAYYGP